MPASSLYRADLVLMVAARGAAMPPEVAARLCGFEVIPSAGHQEELQIKIGGSTDISTPPDPQSEPEPKPAALEKFRFWRAESLHVDSEEVSKQRYRMPEEIKNAPHFRNAGSEDDFEDNLKFPLQPLKGQPLLAWSRLWPFLREILGRRKPGRQPDLPRVIRLLAAGRPMLRLPRRLRRAWHPEVHVLLDRREALASYWDDYDDLLRRLKLARGIAGLRISKLELRDFPSKAPGATGFAREDHPLKQTATAAGIAGEPFRLPPSDSAVLLLGDLNQYQPAPLQAPWLALGRKMRNRGIVPWALCPCPYSRWSPQMAQVWNLSCWDRGQRLPVYGGGQSAKTLPEEDCKARIRQQLDALFPLLAATVRVERGLLRDLRFLLSGAKADVGAEYDAFQSPEACGLVTALTLQTDKLRELRARFTDIAPDLLKRVVETITRHHVYCREVFGHIDIWGLHDVLLPAQWDALVCQGVVPEKALEEARIFERRMVRTVHDKPRGFDAAGTAAFGGRDVDRMQGEALKTPEIQAMWALANLSPNRKLPDWVRPENIAWIPEEAAEETAHRIVITDCLMAGGLPGRGSPAGVLKSSRSSFFAMTHRAAERPETLELAWEERQRFEPENLRNATGVVLASGRETLRLAPFERPAWAEKMWYDRRGLAARFSGAGTSHVLRWKAPGMDADGRPSKERVSGKGRWQAETSPSWAEELRVDDFGLAAQFRVGGVPFVLRWIPPGRFLMGSPEDEPGRYSYEGPQHEVTITKGYWMGETLVTQAQWKAAVAEAAKDQSWFAPLIKKTPLKTEPSHFKGSGELPVESVNWHESNLYCQLLNRLLEGRLPSSIRFHLPTEAQWEHACRAGTRTALYTGGITIKGENHAPELDAIAWYGGNSGRDPEVENPHDSKDFPNKQYEDAKAGTHRVKLKKPNDWGLYDMLGNVFEWCSDAWDASAYQQRKTDVIDPMVTSPEKSASRVVRGGSWDLDARDCRAACRFRNEPALRWGDLGFRLSAGQEPGTAEPQGAERPSVPERRSRG